MKQKITTYVKNGLSRINHPLLIASIVVSLGLWYLNRLGHTYTATVTLPVSIIAASDSPAGVLANEHAIECRIEATGYELLRYRLYPKRYRQEIDLNRVELRPVAGTNRSEVVPLSLRNAIAEKLGGEVDLQAILTQRIEISTAPFRTKKLPVVSGMEFDFRKPYMAVGPIRFTPAEVEVRSLDFVLDSIQAVVTQYRKFPHIGGSVSGSVPLEPIANVVFPLQEVAFEQTVEAYTEIVLHLPVALRGATGDPAPVVSPAGVEVRLHVAGSRSVERIEPYVDLGEMTDDGRYTVVVPSAEGIEVRSIEPARVELITEAP